MIIMRYYCDSTMPLHDILLEGNEKIFEHGQDLGSISSRFVSLRSLMTTRLPKRLEIEPRQDPAWR